MKKIIKLSHSEAKQYFLKNESYVNFDLPQYFVFNEIIKKISDFIEGKKLSDFCGSYLTENNKQKLTRPCDYENVNYKFLNNKDGKFSWRPLQLINPALYVSLVHNITEEENWNLIVERFEEFSEDDRINCFSIPLQSEDELSDKATNVSNWWESIEQKSIEYALEYDYVLHIDLSDCYGSIYTHSISWALHTKEVAKQERKKNKLIGNIIDSHLQDMSYGQTNGIPQGSSLMDLIAEMVLGYADLELSKQIKELTNFEIIRYRDDYRIFTNNPQTAEQIVKHITEILVDLGLRLNGQKTLFSSNVIESSIKPDKLFWLKSKRSNKSLQEHLFLIHGLAKDFPNSGTLIKALNSFFERIKNIDDTHSSIRVLVSIIIDIAYKNPRTYPIVSAILSKFLALCDAKETEYLTDLTMKKFEKIPNTGHLQIWLQRALLKSDTKRNFEEKLCKKIDDPNLEIWNCEWLKPNLRNIINNTSFIDTGIIEEMSETIDSSEVQLFETRNNYT